MTKYENCKKNMMHKIVTEFNSGKLKSSSGNKVKSKSQAIAIGLSMSQNKCQKYFNNNDKEKLKIEVDRFLNKEKLSYSGVLDVIKYIDLIKGKEKFEYKYTLISFILTISKKQIIPEKIVNVVIKSLK